MKCSTVVPIKKVLTSLIGCFVVLSLALMTKTAQAETNFEISNQAENEVQVRTMVVLAFGDSITYGTGSNSGGYPPKLAALLNANGTPAKVLNYGVRGEPTSRSVGRIAEVLAAHRNASYILILEGTNDLSFGLSLDATQRNLEAMVNRSREYGVTPVLATLTPDTRGSIGFAKNIEATYNPMILGIGNNLGVAVVDLYNAVASDWRSLNVDGIHLNDRGYQIIAEAWYGAIRSGGGGGGGGQGGDGGGSGCFIATAAFGSSLAPHVRLLQEFRDEIILALPGGEQLVALYYKFSPPVAELISKNPWMQTLVRGLLYPLIGMSYLVLAGTFVPITLLIIAMSAGMVMVYRVRRRRVSGQVVPGI